MVLTDREGKTMWLNPRFEAMTGYSLPEMVGRKPGSLLQGPMSDLAAVAVLREAIAAGHECSIQLVNYTKAGQPYWTNLELHPARNEQNEVTNFVALQRDITSERLELILQQVQNQVLKEISLSPSVVAALRRSALAICQGLRWSRAACFEVEHGHLKGGEWLTGGENSGAALSLDMLSERLEAALRDRAEPPEERRGDWISRRISLPDGDDTLIVLACGQPAWGVTVLMAGKGDLGAERDAIIQLMDHVGEAISHAGERLSLLQDLRLQKRRAESEASKATAAATELQQANDKLIAIARATALQTMVGGVIHEINQPLAALGTYLAVLRARLAGPGDRPASPASEIVLRAEEQLSRCSAIMQKFREFGGVEGFKPSSVRLCDLVDDAVALSLVRERDPGLRLSVVHSEEPIVVVVDITQLKLVIINLLQNAVDASVARPGRHVEIETTVTDASWVRVAVRDRGDGIPASVRERLFQPFVTTKPGGTGTGLAVCRMIVEASGGRIWYEPRQGGGACFCFSLRYRSRVG